MFPTKRDYWYIVIILIITLVYILSFQVVDIDNINSKLSFTGTIASIILSVIAIIYTLIVSIGNSKVQNELNKSSGAIKKITKNLNKSIVKLCRVSNNIDKIDIVANELASMKEIVDRVSDTNFNIEDLLIKSMDINSSNGDYDILNNKIGAITSDVFKNKLLFKYLVYLVYIYENDLLVIDSMLAFGEYINSDSSFYNGVGLGIFILLKHTNILSMEKLEHNMKIKKFDENYVKEIKKYEKYNECYTDILEWITQKT